MGRLGRAANCGSYLRFCNTSSTCPGEDRPACLVSAWDNLRSCSGYCAENHIIDRFTVLDLHRGGDADGCLSGRQISHEFLALHRLELAQVVLEVYCIRRGTFPCAKPI